MNKDRTPVTSPDDPRLARMGQEDVPGADQIPQMLAATRRHAADSGCRLVVDTADAKIYIFTK
jgi:hypothetical protein